MMTEAEKEKLLALAEGYKEHIYNTLLELLPKRLERIDRQDLQGKTTEEVLSLMYMQGVAEALDNFEVQELLKALEEGGGLRA